MVCLWVIMSLTFKRVTWTSMCVFLSYCSTQPNMFYWTIIRNTEQLLHVLERVLHSYRKQAYCIRKYCWSNTCSLPVPTNFKEAWLQKEYLKGYKSEKFSVLCQYKFIPQIWCQYLARRQRKVRKTKFKQKAYLVCNQVKRNKSQTWPVLYQDKFIYQNVTPILQDRIRKSGKRNFCKG